MDVSERLSEIKKANLYRNIKSLSSSQDSYITIAGKEFLLMSSNNYLGLANDNRVKSAVKKAIDVYGVGSGGSRLTTGSYDIHEVLENKLSKFFNREATIVFNSGYSANLGTISAICSENYTVFSDELNHASIIDGCKLSKAKIVIFKHNDMIDLEEKLKNIDYDKALIITEGVFSMDGDIAQIDRIVNLKNKYNVDLMVDDAHGIGVLGERGVIDFFDLNCEIDIYLGTLSKAIGTEGGFVSGSQELINCLRKLVTLVMS